ncbi:MULTISPECIES: mechanosensitive ion channel domain-containing protein [Ferrimonas]|uniref:mechanosensitive ion channel domain-containing protein n=1 Tax=Ferrimonas TaxID=44011 RepID=UPI0004238CCB|nr:MULTISPECIES: mechanosensitive ion channel domain-containing protein [Ferrimonas]USD39597.1 mechanosensitive ion channel [Ferrimonas sp. SCSIO 43195]
MQWILVALLVGLYLFLGQFIAGAIERYGNKKSVAVYRISYLIKTVRMLLSIGLLLAVFVVLGVEYKELAVLASSIFAVVGVALFAQWSILSNITASFVIFFAFPYRVGDYIKVVDKDDDISGVVEEIALFHVLIRQGDKLFTYPNSLILQKSVIKLPHPANTDAQHSNNAQPIDNQPG